LLFAGHVGLIVIPLMLFHQIQLMVCASLARHYAARRVTASEPIPALPQPPPQRSISSAPEKPPAALRSPSQDAMNIGA
jgi:hypothetical protein